MGRVLAMEAPGVVMTALYPGVIVTPGGHWDNILRNNPEHAGRYISERCPLGRFGEIKELVPSVLFFCSQHASFAHGSIIGIDGGQSKHFAQYNYEP
jgi:3-oxoacyl-[acyl-carrier protein] reductase